MFRCMQDTNIVIYTAKNQPPGNRVLSELVT